MTDDSENGGGIVAASGRFTLGGDLTVRRLGYGAMRLTGEGIWGPPKDPDNALAVLRRAVDLGVDFIDTADSYGPYVSEELVRDALYPYRGVTVATKAGLLRTGPNKWIPCGRPDYLRQEAEMSLRRLGVETIDLFQLHRIDPHVAADEQFGLLADLQREGKVREVGLSQVSVADIEAAGKIVDVASVQNRYNLVDRSSDDVLRHCTEHGIGFIPWAPADAGKLAEPGNAAERAAEKFGATPAQVALAWLLQRSSVMLPIPGTSSLEHLEENCGAASLDLDRETVATLDAAA
ncbi:aryl-alcohol dehydrogenase-like predicted oxidoreductase [Actinomycetospora succinea]|uniref:Aryl-alcohol dehydrogenase-like predicted oxidoreductase n=1 Tax=Actinomycetospora succinea TaxID=663603 RepID=A0A4R6VNU5_9PSEU|nr:aldo/keto reductase [Actinomycetospora succinea]TDQ61055.1 aryl-alcohol dehydrogenase-like predicted oxidoreductase [Actinomycetospora succinea]